MLKTYHSYHLPFGVYIEYGVYTQPYINLTCGPPDGISPDLTSYEAHEMRIPPIMIVRVGQCLPNVYDTSMSLWVVREVGSSCNIHGKLPGIHHKAPCSFHHLVDHIVGIALTCPASSVPGAVLCPRWEEGSVPHPSSVWCTSLHHSPPR